MYIDIKGCIAKLAETELGGCGSAGDSRSRKESGNDEL